MNVGILKTRLFNLEQNAHTLEKIVLNDLRALMTLPTDDKLAGYEAKVLRKLHRLDDIQEEIDQTVAKLKEAGAYEPVRQGRNIYEYRPPKPVGTVTEISKPKRVRRAKTAWDNFSEQLDGDGRFTVADVATKLNTDLAKCRAKIKHWQGKGYIETAEKVGRNVIYRRVAA
jgi:hypothetical protein